MDPNAALRMIDDADRVDAETRAVMSGLHRWLSRGGFEPDWSAYPTGSRRYRKTYGSRKAGTRKAGARKSTTRATARPRARSVRSHAAVARAFSTSGTDLSSAPSMGGIQIGDIVQRADAVGKNRYVVVDIRGPWILTRRISGAGAPGIIQFPSAQMLRKVG